jgi:glycosyltransferase involved in cell wall biosynthesis
LSVLLPAFQAARTLPACLESIRRQVLTDWECIVVDDGSTDETAAIARAAAAADARFRVFALPHRGLVAALNAGLEVCRGRYVARMDADDVMRRDRLHAQAAMLEARPALAAVGCHVRLFPRRGLTPWRRAYESWLNAMRTPEDVRRDALVECPVAHPALMLRTDLARAFGYHDVAWPEDYDLVLRLLAAGRRIGVVSRRLLAWRDSPGRLSRVDPRYGLDRFVACRAHFLAAGLLAATRDYVLWGYGGTGRALRRALLAHGKVPSHIVEIKPTRIGQRIHGADVIAPPALVALRGRPIVVSVARAGPRAEIRAALAAMGFVELRDFVCAA